MAAIRRSLWRTLITWMRVVLPPWWTVTLFVAGLIGCELLAHFFMYRIADWDGLQFHKNALLLHQPRDTWLAVGLVMYGCYRVGAMHPFFRPEYAEWLGQTPWSGRLPLPLGPVYLVPQDAVIFLLAWLVSLDTSKFGFHALVVLFLLPYLVALIAPLRVMDATAHAYLIAYGLAAAVWLGLPSPNATLVLIALCFVAWHGLPTSLNGFAWNVAPMLWEHLSPMMRFKRNSAALSKPLGYPFAQLSPRPEFMAISSREALLLSWLAACWLWALASNIPDGQERAKVCIVVAIAGILVSALGRSLAYFLEYRPPISLLGRLVTGQWIIPGHDRAWLPIGCAVLVAIATMLTSSHFPGSIIGPLALGLGLTLLLGMPPRLRDWALTGNHRIVANTSRRNEFIEL